MSKRKRTSKKKSTENKEAVENFDNLPTALAYMLKRNKQWAKESNARSKKLHEEEFKQSRKFDLFNNDIDLSGFKNL